VVNLTDWLAGLVGCAVLIALGAMLVVGLGMRWEDRGK